MGEPRRTALDRQIELTDAALHIIATKGITALSTRSLAAEVGLSTGAIFRHFASLEALLDAVVARVEGVLESTYPPSTLPPVERLERFIEARSTAVGNRLGILRLVVSEQFLLALPKSGSERLAACVQKTRAFVLECVRDGQDAGDLRSDLPAETLAPIVMGTVQMLALSPLKTRQRDDAALADTGAVPGQQRDETSDRLRVARVELDRVLAQRSEATRGIDVARALANEPSLILADEPTAALDSVRSRSVMELFRSVAHDRGAAVLVVTHDHRALEVFDVLYEMEDGRRRPHRPERPGLSAAQ